MSSQTVSVEVVDAWKCTELPVLEGLMESKSWYLVAYELGPGFHCGMHTTKAASGTHPPHIHTGIPDQWNRGKIRSQ